MASAVLSTIPDIIEHMFEPSWIDDLTASEAADELARVRDLVVAAEATQFALAAHWADLHAPDVVEDVCRSLPGMPRLVRSGPEGCPEVGEYAGAELAVLLGRSTASGEQLIRDAVTVRHRHPGLWAGIRAGRVRVWLATQVARRCARAHLPAPEARWVDEQTTPYVTTLPPGRFLDLVEAKIIGADPDAAQERARARALARFVHAGRTDADGLRTIVARASAGDVTYLVAVLDRIARILTAGGDPRPVEVLRADALRIVANPARALALLTSEELDASATGTGSEPAVEPAHELTDQALFPSGTAGWMRDTTGALLPGAPDPSNLPERPVTEEDLEQLTAAGATCAGAVGATAGGQVGSPVESHADPAPLRAMLQALARFDARRLEPLVVLHVHLSQSALTGGHGVARVEELGPVVLGEFRDWLMQPYSPDRVCPRVQLRPVLDVDVVRPVDRYEWPAAMSDLTTVRTPYEVFPYGTLSSRKADDDHVQPFVAPDGGGPPGQTRLTNNAKLSRFHHRLKTNGEWALRHPEPGVYLWRTPHGHWFRLDHSGTHHLGRDPDLDTQWLNQPHAA